MSDDLRARLTALATERLREHGPHIECNNAGCRRRGLTGMHCGDPCESVHEDCADFAAWTQVLTLLASPAEPVRESDGVSDLIERSSLGTPEAKALRATVSDEDAARVVARSKEIKRESDGVGLRELAEVLLHIDFPITDWENDLTEWGRVKWLQRAEAVLASDWLAARVAEAEAKALEEAADGLAVATEGANRVGTRTWPTRHRDIYSLAIEEASAALRDRARGLRGQS